ncbi:MFS transporter [Halalkalibacter hemicellulosilyticus]|uniref:Membrane protein n=1 Tax=Halalkalibacter hemicellulosilyticusJCM 9152 TaxID=1236971 RepID=W4QED8_9BACI|nr:MFS transporter [Halalkalibacter hemicellulosilyticus]GAE30425.1 membrane protein [Halalkalibacter hemicellulosilyticusJCM 9152]
MKKYSKQETSWMFYDWASNAFSVIITTAVFPIFYKAQAELAGIEGADSTAYLGYTIAIFTFILAIIGPILGTIADYEGYKKRFFISFLILGIFSTFALVFVPEGEWLLLLVFYTLASLGSTGANLFYDAFLVDVTENKRMNKVSARGFGYGYIGGAIPFVLSIVVILLAQQGVIPISSTAASKIAFLIACIWWAIFAIPLLKNVKQIHAIKRDRKPIRTSFLRLKETVTHISQYKHVTIFLIAYFFYIDGVGTIISMATAYGTDVGVDATVLLVVLFVTQIVAAPFALLYGKLADRFSAKIMLNVGIFVYTIVCIYGYFLETALDFWILAMLVATSQGGMQALSRSYFAKMVPKHKSNEFFGFYNIFGKFASVTGPLLVGVTAQVTGKSNAGVLSLIVLFIVGAIVLFFVPSDKKIEQINSEAALRSRKI